MHALQSHACDACILFVFHVINACLTASTLIGSYTEKSRKIQPMILLQLKISDFSSIHIYLFVLSTFFIYVSPVKLSGTLQQPRCPSWEERLSPWMCFKSKWARPLSLYLNSFWVQNNQLNDYYRLFELFFSLWLLFFYCRFLYDLLCVFFAGREGPASLCSDWTALGRL